MYQVAEEVETGKMRISTEQATVKMHASVFYLMNEKIKLFLSS